MTKITIEILKAWYLAHKQAEKNSTLLILNHGLFNNLCTARMNVLFETEKLLYGIKVDEKYPKELTRHLEAEKNKSTCSCNYSSIKANKHPECIKKTKEWFDSKAMLMCYIELFVN